MQGALLLLLLEFRLATRGLLGAEERMVHPDRLESITADIEGVLVTWCGDEGEAIEWLEPLWLLEPRPELADDMEVACAAMADLTRRRAAQGDAPR